jgi:hypothetical protein
VGILLTLGYGVGIYMSILGMLNLNILLLAAAAITIKLTHKLYESITNAMQEEL